MNDLESSSYDSNKEQIEGAISEMSFLSEQFGKCLFESQILKMSFLGEQFRNYIF